MRSLVVACVLGGVCVEWAASQVPSLPVAFIEDQGQWDSGARFVARHRRGALAIHPNGLLLQHIGADGVGADVRLLLDGARPGVAVSGEGPRRGSYNFFVGEPARWRRDVPGFGAVRLRSVWPGIDVRVHADRGAFEYDLELAPGTSLDAVRIRCAGATDLKLEADGSLTLETAAGPLRQSAPNAWQEDAGGRRHAVACGFRLLDAATFGFVMHVLDSSWHTVIDPGLEWSTFLGDSGYDEITAVVVADNGEVTVAGNTSSSRFPVTPGAFDTTFNCSVFTTDVFVTRLRPDGSGLVWSTFLGGCNADDRAYGVAVAANGEATVVGRASWDGLNNTTFPTTPGAFQRTAVGIWSGFVTRFSADGSTLVFSTFLAGGGGVSYVDGVQEVYAVALAPGGDAVVAGYTKSQRFPTTPGAFQRSHGSQYNPTGFVARIGGTGNLVASTYLGGSDIDWIRALALAPDGSVVIAGETRSVDFPTTGSFQTILIGDFDAFVARLDASLGSLRYGTYLGGRNYEQAFALAVERSGAVTVTGMTSSPDFPTTPGAFDTSIDTGPWPHDAFVTKLDPSGQTLAFSTFLGSSEVDIGYGLAVDGGGNVVVVGETRGADFPTTEGAFNRVFNQGSPYQVSDAFVSRLDSRGARLLYSTYLGGESGDLALTLALTATGSAVVCGLTHSSAFPVTPGAFQTALRGAPDAFVTRLDLLPAGVSRYGVSTAACAGPIPMGVLRVPRAGDPAFGTACYNAPPGSLAFLAFALLPDSGGTVVEGIRLHLDATSPMIVVQALSSAAGVSESPIPLQGVPQGLRVFGQYVWLNSPSCGAPRVLSASDALALTVQ